MPPLPIAADSGPSGPGLLTKPVPAASTAPGGAGPGGRPWGQAVAVPPCPGRPALAAAALRSGPSARALGAQPAEGRSPGQPPGERQEPGIVSALQLRCAPEPRVVPEGFPSPRGRSNPEDRSSPRRREPSLDRGSEPKGTGTAPPAPSTQTTAEHGNAFYCARDSAAALLPAQVLQCFANGADPDQYSQCFSNHGSEISYSSVHSKPSVPRPAQVPQQNIPQHRKGRLERNYKRNYCCLQPCYLLINYSRDKFGG